MKVCRTCIMLAIITVGVIGLFLQGGCERFFTNDLGKTKVCELHVKILVGQQDVLRLDVSMDNAAFVLGHVSRAL